MALFWYGQKNQFKSAGRLFNLKTSSANRNVFVKQILKLTKTLFLNFKISCKTHLDLDTVTHLWGKKFESYQLEEMMTLESNKF